VKLLRLVGDCHPTPTAFGLILLVAGVSCDRSVSSPDGTKSGNLAGDPIESVQQVEGVAPVTITNTQSPPDGGAIDSTSFTIGLFDDDDDAFCQQYKGIMTYCIGGAFYLDGCHCSIGADLNPAHVTTQPLPPFDDVSTVEVLVNVGASQSMHWDWNYKAWYQAPFGEFSAEVVDQNGETTTVIQKVSAPAPWGFRPEGIGIGAAPAYSTGPQHTDLDLTAWSNQKIKIRFILHTNYDPHFFDFTTSTGVILTGAWDVGTPKVYVSNLGLDACTIDSVAFQAIDSDIDTNPIAPFGKRIFPDKQSLGDATDRSLVCVVAHTSTPNCRVTFRALDVDDPSSDPEIDADDNGDDNDSRGISNFTSGPGCQEKLTSGADGVARTAFRVSKFPGDNYVIVAGANPGEVNAVKSKGQDVVAADGQPLSPDRVQRTPLLTMGVVTGNHAAGTIRAVMPASNTPNLVQIRTDALLDLRRFEAGRIVIDGRSLVVDLNDVRSVFVTGAVADFRQFRGRPFLLYDDDDYNHNDRPNFRGDEGEDVRMPSTFLVRESDTQEANVFAAAYVRPVYDLSSTDSAPFALNILNYDDTTVQDLFSLDPGVAANDSDFWAFALMGAYQGTIASSRDPDDDGGVMGVVDSIGGMAAVVFLETIADVKESAVRNEPSIVAHEIGHLFCLHHGEGGIMGGGSGAISDIVFRPKSIARIRRAIRWYGPCEDDLNAN
jgi:hypothetical protein